MQPDRADLSQLLQPLLGGAPVSGGIEPLPHHTGDPGESSSVRIVDHAGHRIRIETTYRISIDDQPFPDPIHVNDDGTVHYHGLPQYSLPSAVDLLRLIVDRIPVEGAPPPIGGHQHGEHGGQGEDDEDHGHGHGDHGGGGGR